MIQYFMLKRRAVSSRLVQLLFTLVLCCSFLPGVSAFASQQYAHLDSAKAGTTPSAPLNYRQYFAVGGGTALSDATFDRFGLLYSMMYGLRLAPQSDIEVSLNYTGTDGKGSLFLRLLTVTNLDISYLFQPFPSSGLRIGVGGSGRFRQFYWTSVSPPNFNTLEDRSARDLSIGAHVKIDYVVYQTASIDFGLQVMGQYFFAPISGEYSRLGQAVTIQDVRLHNSRQGLVGGGFFFRVQF
jgi:hypothetical protein